MRRLAALVAIILFTSIAAVPACADDSALQRSVGQLRDSVGDWDVTTEFLAPDGTVAQSVDGTYSFEWVIPDKLVRGTSRLPDLDMVSAILFYIDEKEAELEMVSVGADGKLWIMSGPLGEETRLSQPYSTADGGEAQLRFTRYNVAADRFESKMEYTTDGGKTWTQGNRQVFARKKH